MIRWEYHQVSLFRPIDDDRLAARGRDGWELVTCSMYRDSFYYVFKRPIIE